jgi:predicted RND superfamily exporter protein
MFNPSNVQFIAILALLAMAGIGFIFQLVATTITGRPLDPQSSATLTLLIQLAIGVAIGAGSTAFVNKAQMNELAALKEKRGSK